MKKHLGKRILAWFLTLCAVLGLLPTVTVFEAKAAEDLSAQISTLVSTLKTSYNSFTIPVNKEVFNYTSLDGVFFIRESSSGKTIDYGVARASHTDRLSANTSSGEAATKYYHLSSIGVSATNEGSFTAVNGSTPNNLNYAVEIKKYSGTITRDTTTVTTVDGKNYTGWSGYIKYEYNRKNTWSGDKLFGEYLGINGVPGTGDPVYSIKSLHPSRSSTPYVAASNGGGSMNYTSSAFPWFLRVYSTNASAKIYKLDPTGGSRYTYWLGIDTDHNNCVSAHTMSQIVREDRNKSTADKFKNNNKKAFKFQYWDFFQVSPLALDLYKALETARTYVTNGNPNGKYPAETYLNFLKFVQSAMATYNSKRTIWNADAGYGDRITCDALARDLRSYMALLDIESKPNSYMDIPMEVLDFRADGLMFEHCGGTNPYTLNSSIPSVSGNVSVPGTPGTGDNGATYRAGLVESQLVKGQIVYTKETVQYIAEALFTQYLTLSHPDATATKSSFDTYWNSVFMQLVDSEGMKGNKRTTTAAINAYPLGAKGYDHDANYNATIAKTDTKSNGGILRFDQVENCYDLAYYMLTNMWRETAKDDYVDTARQLPYNLKIDELRTLRMLKDSNGYYVYSSDKVNGRCLDSGVIFNHNLTTAVDSNAPYLNAAAELGFESPSRLGNDSTGVKESSTGIYGKRNYYTMYHMRSSFIYYEKKNLEFTFTGDDDVYFFINDQLVCDIGGMHTACARGVKLNGQVAKDLGLRDGDICTFDMFLIDRHTTQINLNLRTNIEMMPVDAVTEKVQYLYTKAGEIGEDVREGAVVTDKTEIGYGFKLLNRSNHAAVDLSFWDEDLGVSLSGDGISLNGYANVEDLVIIYRTHDPQSGEIDQSIPQNMTYDQLFPLLSEAVDDMSTTVPMDSGAYQITGLTEEQLIALLELGLPANVQISIYGFHRTAQATVGGYSGTLYTSCKPISGRNEDETYTFGAPINGSSTRSLNVQNMNSVTAEPLNVVIDYGKPVTFTVEEIFKAVAYDPQDAKLSFCGIQENGTHGKIVYQEPEEIPLKDVGDTLPTAHGVFDIGVDFIRYTLHDMLDTVERVYAIVCVNDTYLGSSWYLTVEIRIIPANIMYYEAEKLEADGDLTFTEKYVEEITQEPAESESEENPEEGDPSEVLPEDDGSRINNHINRLTDSGEVEHNVSTYYPKGDKKVLFFDFNTYGDSSNPYSGNSAYGGVNFGNVANWWSPGYGSITGMNNGLITFTTTNNDNVWGYIATGAKSASNPTVANAAQFPLQYRPSDDDWMEIRLKINKTDKQDAKDTHLRVEFFPMSADTSLSRAAVSTKNFSADNIGDGYFVLTFPLATTIENSADPGGIKYTELSVIRRINFLIRGMDKSETFTTVIDYIYIGPEETVPSNMGGNSLYFGFDNTEADRYRYTDPIYGGNFNFDIPEGWSNNSGRSPSVQVIDGVLTSTVGAAGSYTTNSPWYQTAILEGNQQTIDYPASGAEVARIRVKFKDLISDLNVDPEKVEINNYPEYPVARLGFVINDHATYEDSACWVDWPLTEEQLSGGEFVTLTADLRQLLKDHNATRIAAVRLTVVNVAGQEGKTGYVYVDEIYVGPEESQDSDTYIAPTETVIPTIPVDQTNVPTYDTGILYFGFGNSAADIERYGKNPVYSGKNFDTVATWQGNSGRTISITNGALNLEGPTGGYSYTLFNTGTSTSDYNHMNYTPATNDWFEIRIKINDTSVLVDKTKIQFDIELRKDSTYMYKTHYDYTVGTAGGVQSNQYYTIAFRIPENSGAWANTIPYASVGTVKRFAFNPTGLYTNSTYKCSIDYIYIGPEDKLPSRQSSYDYLYFGFEADNVARYKYGSAVYGGDNFDTPEKWRNHGDRSSDAVISGGCMTYTVKKQGFPWFETSRNGASDGCGVHMHFNPAKAEVVQIRMKFNNIQLVDKKAEPTMDVYFGNIESDKIADEPVQFTKSIPLYSAKVLTDGKWFTYIIELEDLLKDVPRVTGMRIRLMNIYHPDDQGSVSFDYIYVGPRLSSAPEAYHRDEEYTYGYDSTYTLDSMYSDNETLYTEGRGVPIIDSNGAVNYEGAEQYTELGFSFTGTGFDLIARTGAQQATIRVSVYKTDEWFEENRVKTLTVNTKGELELYQIPIVSIQGLEYGTYHVKIWVNNKLTEADFPQIPGLNIDALLRGNQFCLDAIRIYDPINVSGESLGDDQEIALSAYKGDKEAYQYIKEIRNILLSEELFDTLNGTLPGMVFLDVNSSNVDPETGTVNGTASDNYTTADVATYNKIGPKNEVYLALGQAVAFRLLVDSNMPIGSMDIAAKIITPDSTGKLAVGFVTAQGTVIESVTSTVESATGLYCALDTSKIAFHTSNSTKEVYMVIYNQSEGSTGDNVISLTDVKVAYEAHPDTVLPEDGVTDTEIHRRSAEADAPVQFLVDAYVTTAVASFVKALSETPLDGDTDPEPTPDPIPIPGVDSVQIVDTVQIRHSLNLASDISVNYLIAKPELEGFEDLRMICTVPGYKGNELAEYRVVELMPELKGDYYYFTLTGLTAVQMNDEVSVYLSMTKDGTQYRSLTDHYSVAQYAYGQLSKTGNSEGLRSLCAELLRYGSAAQNYKAYRTDCLADSALTEEHRAILVDTEAVTFDSFNTLTDEVEGASVRWAGKSLLLDSKVAIRYVLDLSSFEGDPAELSIRLTYKDLDGEEMTAVLEDPRVYSEELSYYSLDFDGLLAAELRSPVYARVYHGEIPVSAELEYSASTYGNNKTGTLGQLCKCLMAYSDSAKAYFAN